MTIEAKPAYSVGVSMKRKEDPRFIQGKGNYVDDLSLPGMLYLSLVRSPYPHANLTSIDISEAMKVPEPGWAATTTAPSTSTSESRSLAPADGV